MPVNHVVLFKWKEGTKPADIESALSALRDMASKVPCIQELSVGATFTLDRNKGYSHCLVVRLSKKQDVEAYAAHPAHVEVGSNKIKPILEEACAMDYEFVSSKL
eukprot:gnl/TRDRNA2_/TRDRNA2_83409_c0_seq1.p1 gnl/TRDRNA2_/TRDRNA2_83409_c0~~gnl/TRDRNA2_/TRDRNA2_83409_c0_seq1.p1  ORF type:complete len:114 (-),score=21.96 gnl/TRDRNA2_/TRDRNA2_83409_c0_seq1:36-350(-)